MLKHRVVPAPSVLFQGLHGCGLTLDTLRVLLAEVGNAAAYNSLLLGELPELEEAAGRNALAEAGMLATLLSPAQAALDCGRCAVPLSCDVSWLKQSPAEPILPGDIIGFKSQWCCVRGFMHHLCVGIACIALAEPGMLVALMWLA
jgi:hypothetical protein